MKKIKVKISINDYQIESTGKLENAVLEVNDKDILMLFDMSKLTLVRKNKDFEIKIDFKNKKVSYKIPEITDNIIDEITILSLTNYDKEYNIKYRMEENLFNLNIKYETIE